ncbi:MAG: FliM/FliN family flagellar motor switch protein [Myxococcota bacterium]
MSDVMNQRIFDVIVEVTVVLGERKMPLREVGRLEPDTIIDLEQGVNEPLKLVCGDRHIADGELVMVDGGGVGIRITKVLGKEEE